MSDETKKEASFEDVLRAIDNAPNPEGQLAQIYNRLNALVVEFDVIVPPEIKPKSFWIRVDRLRPLLDELSAILHGDPSDSESKIK